MNSRKNLHRVLLEITEDVRTLYKCKWCDIRLLSGINMMMAALGGLKQKTQNLLCLGRKLGGHTVTADLAKSFGYSVSFIPERSGRTTYRSCPSGKYSSYGFRIVIGKDISPLLFHKSIKFLFVLFKKFCFRSVTQFVFYQLDICFLFHHSKSVLD